MCVIGQKNCPTLQSLTKYPVRKQRQISPDQKISRFGREAVPKGMRKTNNNSGTYGYSHNKSTMATWYLFILRFCTARLAPGSSGDVTLSTTPRIVAIGLRAPKKCLRYCFGIYDPNYACLNYSWACLNVPRGERGIDEDAINVNANVPLRHDLYAWCSLEQEMPPAMLLSCKVR